MEYLYGIIVVLLGGIFFLNGKKKSAEALVNNDESKKELNKLDQDIAKNTGLLDAEEEKRKQIQKEIDLAKQNDDLARYFNTPK